MQWNDLSIFKSSATFISIIWVVLFSKCVRFNIFFFCFLFFRLWKIASLASCLCIYFDVFSHLFLHPPSVDYINGWTSTQNDFSSVKFHILFSYKLFSSFSFRASTYLALYTLPLHQRTITTKAVMCNVHLPINSR